MNRREILKALAGLGVLSSPLRRWWAWRPKVGETPNPETDDEVIALRSSDFVPTSDGFADTDTYETLVKKEGTKAGGHTIFVDLVAGDDANDGLTPETAVTWNGWIPLVESRECDMVICFCPEENA